MNYEAVIFDIGNVLVEWNPHGIIRRALTSDNPELFADRFFGGRIWRSLNLGEISEAEAKRRHADEDDMRVGEIEAIYREIENSQEPLRETADVLLKLKARGTKAFALSNNIRENVSRLRARYAFFDEFDDIMLSCEVGLLKPDSAIFHLACERWALTPPTTVFIDDHAPNIDAATSLGFQTILFREPAQLNALAF